MNKIKIIAEIGNNHEGNIYLALKLIDEAKEAGCDFVKFQAGSAQGFARVPEDIEKYRRFVLSVEDFKELHNYAENIGIECFFSVWSEEYLELKNIEHYHKIPARKTKEIIDNYDNLPSSYNRHLDTFISIMPNMEYKGLDIENAMPLFCISEYPATKINWIEFIEMRCHFSRIGFSDHFIGVENAKRAIYLGATVIEKHFTLWHDFSDFRDHKLSATPEEMQDLVRYARMTEQRKKR